MADAVYCTLQIIPILFSRACTYAVYAQSSMRMMISCEVLLNLSLMQQSSMMHKFACSVCHVVHISQIIITAIFLLNFLLSVEFMGYLSSHCKQRRDKMKKSSQFDRDIIIEAVRDDNQRMITKRHQECCVEMFCETHASHDAAVGD